MNKLPEVVKEARMTYISLILRSNHLLALRDRSYSIRIDGLKDPLRTVKTKSAMITLVLKAC